GDSSGGSRAARGGVIAVRLEVEEVHHAAHLEMHGRRGDLEDLYLALIEAAAAAAGAGVVALGLRFGEADIDVRVGEQEDARLEQARSDGDGDVPAAARAATIRSGAGGRLRAGTIHQELCVRIETGAGAGGDGVLTGARGAAGRIELRPGHGDRV